MCGRIVRVFDAKLGMWVTRYDANWDNDPKLAKKLREASYNVPPLSWFPVVACQEDGRPHVVVAQWGFPAPARAGRIINTRVETAATSPLWRSLVGKGNCVVPVTGFYEWAHSGSLAQPHYVRRKDGEPMLLAGLVAERHVEGEPRLVMSILTREPDEVVAALHDRMPAILEQHQVDAWLAGGGVDMLRGPREGVLAEHPVSTAVNPSEAEGPQLIAPVARQARLG